MSNETQYGSVADLMSLFLNLCDHAAFRGSHVSIDRDPQGNVYVAVAPDWVDASGLRFLLEQVAQFEVAVALTKDGLRIESHSSPTVAAVDALKAELEADDDDDV